jgi:hypothetical protein
LHLAPALAAAFAGIKEIDRQRENIDKNAISLLFMSQAYDVIKLLQEGIRPYLTYICSIFQMSDPLTNMGAKSRKSKYMKWLNEEN